MEKRGIVSPGAAILIVVTVFVVALFGGAAFLLVFGTGAEALQIATLLSELLILIVPLCYMLLRKVDIRKYIGLEIKAKNILLGIGWAGVLILFDITVTSALVSILGPSQAVEESNRAIADLSSSRPGLILVAFSLALAGVCEEFMFRAFLQNAIDRRYSFLPAVIVSSVAWALFHFDPQFVYTISIFLAGLLLGFVYHHWNSYVVSATAHSTLNLVVLALLLLGV